MPKKPRPKVTTPAPKPSSAGAENPEVTQRMQVLALAFKDRYSNLAAFAAAMGLSYNQWNNIHSSGFPLSKDVAFKLVQALPGLTLDWLWFGYRQGLSHEIIQRLDKASAALNTTTEPS